MLLGARTVGREAKSDEDLSDSRVKAGILLASPGRGGLDLSDFAREHTPYLHTEFSGLAAKG